MLHKYSWFENFQSFSFEMDKSEVIPVKSTGKNHMGWSFNIKPFVQGQWLFGYHDDTTLEPTKEKAKATWVQNNSKLATLILNSIDTSIRLSLLSLTMASEFWNHLSKLCHQNKQSMNDMDSGLRYGEGRAGCRDGRWRVEDVGQAFAWKLVPHQTPHCGWKKKRIWGTQKHYENFHSS